MCYVAQNIEVEISNSIQSDSIQKEYELPDGQVITIGAERFRTPEVLFQPTLVGLESVGIHTLLCNSVLQLSENRNDMYQNIVLCGGSSMFPGLSDRLMSEITSLIPITERARVCKI